MTTSLRARAANGLMWSAVQTWSVRLTTALAFIIISRQLTPAEFGLVALSMSVIAVLTLVGDVGMAAYIVRKPTVSASDSSTAFWTSLALASALAVLLASSAPLVSKAFDEPEMTHLLWALSSGLVLVGAASVPTALLRRELEFKLLAYRGMTATLVGSIVAITLALLGAGAWALVGQSLVRGLLSMVFSFTAARWAPSLTYDRPMAKKMLSFGGAVLGIDLLNQARDRGEDFVLGSIAGTTSLGYWSVANRLVAIIRETGTSVVLSVATPTFARLQHDHKRMVRALDTTLYTSAAVMFPAMAYLSVLSPDLVPMILGQQWATTAAAAQLVAITMAIATMSWFDRTIFIALDRLKPEIAMVASFAAIHVVVVVVVVVTGQSLTVLALALLIKGCLSFPIRAVVLHRVASIPYSVYRRTGRVGCAALIYLAAGEVVTVLLDSGTPLTRVLVGTALAAGIYPAALWVVARPVCRSILADLRSLRGRKSAAHASSSESDRREPKEDQAPATAGTSS